MNYCLKNTQPKFQPQIRSSMAFLIKKVKKGFHRFIWEIKKLLILRVTLVDRAVNFFQFKRNAFS
jgi:hypothetical protein